jgi:hypothetical protein
VYRAFITEEHDFRQQVPGFVNCSAPDFAGRSILLGNHRPTQIGELEWTLSMARKAEGVVGNPFNVRSGRTQREQTDFLQILTGKPIREPDAEHTLKVFHVGSSDPNDAVESTGPQDCRIAP